MTYPPETKSLATIPAIVVAAPDAAATQNGPRSWGLRAQARSDTPSRTPEPNVPATKWNRWIRSASPSNAPTANGRLKPIATMPTTAATIRNARLMCPPRSALGRACRPRVRNGS